MNLYISQLLSRFVYVIVSHIFFLLNVTQCSTRESLKVEIAVRTVMMNKMPDCNKRVGCRNIRIRRIDNNWLMMNGSQFHKVEVAGKKVVWVNLSCLTCMEWEWFDSVEVARRILAVKVWTGRVKEWRLSWHLSIGLLRCLSGEDVSIPWKIRLPPTQDIQCVIKKVKSDSKMREE